MKRNSGFTIIELMIAVAVLGALLAVGIPGWTEMVKNNCLTTKTNALISAMQLARSSAITLRDDVMVTPMCNLDDDDDDAADGVCDNGDEFGDGAVVYRDFDGDNLPDGSLEDVNGNGVLDVGEDLNGNNQLDYEVIRRFEFSCAATLDETNNNIVFTYSSDGAGAPAAIINVCDDRAAGEYVGRQITLSATGRSTLDAEFACP